MDSRVAFAVTFIAFLASASLAQAAAPEEVSHADELAKQLANPVAALISVPFQANMDDGIGSADNGERFTLNVQPVIPISLSDEWNLISRTVAPVIVQSDIFPGAGEQSGLGDIAQSLFFSPKKATGGWIIGVGPILSLPTETDDLLGTGQWAAGPTAVVLKQEGVWTYGSLVNHLWKFAGDDDKPDVNATFLQPFLSRSLGQGQTAAANFEASYDWTASQWTVPLNLTYSKVTKIGSQLVSLGGGIRYYVEKPQTAGDWGVRVIVTLLFPR